MTDVPSERQIGRALQTTLGNLYPDRYVVAPRVTGKYRRELGGQAILTHRLWRLGAPKALVIEHVAQHVAEQLVAALRANRITRSDPAPAISLEYDVRHRWWEVNVTLGYRRRWWGVRAWVGVSNAPRILSEFAHRVKVGVRTRFSKWLLARAMREQAPPDRRPSKDEAKEFVEMVTDWARTDPASLPPGIKRYIESQILERGGIGRGR